MSRLNFQNLPPVLGRSQKGQDSVIEYLFSSIGTTNKYYIEFGAKDGFDCCNTFRLREYGKWKGILIDCDFENPAINLHRYKLTTNNVIEIFKTLEVPESFDFLSVDIDGNDFWILKEILGYYKPRIIMVETNIRFSPETDLVQKYDENWLWRTGWYGASPRAMAKMAAKFNYVPVYLHLDDMFLIPKEELISKGYEIPSWNEVYPNNNEGIYFNHLNNVFNPKMWMTPEGL